MSERVDQERHELAVEVAIERAKVKLRRAHSVLTHWVENKSASESALLLDVGERTVERDRQWLGLSHQKFTRRRK